MRDNNTFCSSTISRFNAAVGSNGSLEAGDKPRSNIFYAEGFEVAALEMIKIALNSNKTEHSIDTLVYPICFNMRHSIELRLKKLWTDLTVLSKFRMVKLREYRNEKLNENRNLDRAKVASFPDIKALQYHDINEIWKSISEYAPVIDDRFKEIICLLTPFILDIADIDPTGQTFRYPSDNESKTHLLDTPLISILILQARFSNLKNAMVFLDNLAEQLIREYSLCREYDAVKREYKKDSNNQYKRISHTNKLSYFDIINIIYAMSKYKDTSTPCHIEARNDIRREFNLSSNDYGKVVHIIHSDIVINNILNHPNELLYLTNEDIQTFFNILNLHTPLTETNIPRPSLGTQIDWSTSNLLELLNPDIAQRENDALNNLLETFDDDKLAEIISLYLLQKNDLYYAQYMRLINENIQELKSFNGDVKKKKNLINHYLEKTNLAQYIITSLYFFNFKEEVHDIVTNHEISNAQWYVNLTSGKYKSAYDEHAYFLYNITSIKNEIDQANDVIEKIRDK